MPIRILIADDNDVVRKLIRQSLEKRGDIEICAQTADGRETVAAAIALKPDVLVLDVRMPSLNGVEVAAIVKKELPAARIILFTMYDDYVGMGVAAAAGVHSILSKPDGISKLLAVVEELLGPENAAGLERAAEKPSATSGQNVHAAGSSQC